ncbi:MAG TPA: methylated-DNA--[protein]-cysteine S-methyltransferase [Opitutaceae bacterium]|nr:methylated-DNA--[protein]-cysteine S-methyltransferase [Opitutaceae bacterium]
MKTIYHTTFPTKFGEFSVAVNEAGAVLATSFGDATALRRRVRAAANPTTEWQTDPKLTAAARTQVRDYLAGRASAFTLDLAPDGTAFQKRVWNELGRIPFGTTRSYADLARRLRSSPRAVGRANATNPICVIVPCHRVIGADGSLTGFAFGTEVKQRLLALESGTVQAWTSRRIRSEPAAP